MGGDCRDFVAFFTAIFLCHLRWVSYCTLACVPGGWGRGWDAVYNSSGRHQAGMPGQLDRSAQEVWEGGRKRGKRAVLLFEFC